MTHARVPPEAMALLAKWDFSPLDVDTPKDSQ